MTARLEPTPIHDELWRDTYAPKREPELFRRILWGVAVILFVVSLLLLAGAA